MDELKLKRPRGTGRIIVRGSRVSVRYSIDGRIVEEKTGIFTAAPGWERKADKLLVKRIGGALNGLVQDSRSLRYEDIRAKLLRDYEVNERKSLRSKDGKPWLDKVTRLDDFFANRRVSDIEADTIRTFAADQKKRGLSNGTINRSISALRRMFNLARQDGTLRNIPYFPTLKEAAPRQGFIEREQYDALSAALPEYLHVVLAIGYFTGMRLAEILGLRWEQIDFLANTITLAAGTTKYDEARVAPIVPELRAVLIKQRSKRHGDLPFVCCKVNRLGAVEQITSFRKAWYTACVKCGLGRMEAVVDGEGNAGPATPRPDRKRPKPKTKAVYRGIIFHDLRRSAVRNLVRSQVPEKIARAINGHKTRSVFDRYNIVSLDDVTEAGRKLAAFHEAAVQKNEDKTRTNCTEMKQANSSIQ